MAAHKPSIPSGTRDFSPEIMVRRNYIFNTIRRKYHLYGYQPIETPAMENLSSLLGKYGEEGDKLLFKVLNSGDFLNKVPVHSTWDNLKEKEIKSQGTLCWADFGISSGKLTTMISEKGLRYDLTVPFARYVVQHRNELTFPFKRYQIQPVWRADRPQKGRYREFYQCDADVIGSDSLLNEVELVQIIDDVFRELGINVQIKINNRKILAGIAEAIGASEKITDITTTIDKLDKIGLDKVNEELQERGLSKESVLKLQPIIKLSGSNYEKLEQIKQVLCQYKVGVKGVDEMKTIFGYLEKIDVKTEIQLDLTLARGLNYYTGAIFEVMAKDIEIGSLCGGGRYDDLAGIFGLENVSGVGISFGADRIYDVMEQSGLFPKEAVASTKVMFVNFGVDESAYCLPIIQELRAAGIHTEMYPDTAKMKKQMSYADNKKIAYVLLAGKDEMEKGVINIKEMSSGNQYEVPISEIVSKLS